MDKELEKTLDEIVIFFETKKGKYVNYNHWISGSTTVVHPIAIWQASHTIVFKLKDCDKRMFRGFDKTLKEKFNVIEHAYYAPTYREYRIRYKVEKC